MRPGDRLSGPAIVESPDTTVVVPTGFVASCDRYRNLQLEDGSAQDG